MCTDNLLHIDSGTGSNDNEIELNNESIGNHVTGNHDMSLIEPEDESESTQENESVQKPSYDFTSSDQNKKNDKCKPKKTIE